MKFLEHCTLSCSTKTKLDSTDAMSPSRIAQLSEQIALKSQNIDDYLAASALPSPSFDEDGPVTLGLSAEIEISRNVVLNASVELQALLQGPVELLRPTVSYLYSFLLSFTQPKTNLTNQLNGTSLEAISRYDMASKVPIGGSITFVELASMRGLYEPDVRRIVRFAIAHHFVFREPRKGVVAHSAASRRLVEDQGVRDGQGLMFDDCYKSFGRV